MSSPDLLCDPVWAKTYAGSWTYKKGLLSIFNFFKEIGRLLIHRKTARDLLPV